MISISNNRFDSPKWELLCSDHSPYFWSLQISPLTSWVTLDKVFNLLKPQLIHLYKRDDNRRNLLAELISGCNAVCNCKNQALRNRLVSVIHHHHHYHYIIIVIIITEKEMLFPNIFFFVKIPYSF